MVLECRASSPPLTVARFAVMAFASYEGASRSVRNPSRFVSSTLVPPGIVDASLF